MAVLAEHLVGRADELGELDRALAELERGRAATVEVTGEPGIGKSRLLNDLGRQADLQRHLVLRGSASELERELPYAMFVDALDGHLRELDPTRRKALGGPTRSALAAVFPAFEPFAADDAPSLRHERYRSHRAVRELLERLTATRPLVLLLDDVHWADTSSVELLDSLLRHPPDAAVLIVLATRARQRPPPLGAMLDRSLREGALSRMELGPLTRAEAAELLAALDEERVSLLYAESGGNPFYLEQLARSSLRWDDTASLDDAAGPDEVDVPPLVAAALAEELSLLPDEALDVLRGAAVAGDPFDPELAAAAGATDDAGALDAVDELLQLDLVRASDTPRRFRFRHPLVRRAVYEATPAGWRIAAHERAADALAVRGVSAVGRAHHVERAARPGDADAVAALRAAGEATADRAPASAAHWFGCALRVLGDDGPADARVELLLARAGSLAGCGSFHEAHAALLESIALVSETTALGVRLTTACAGVEHLLGLTADANGRLRRTLEGLDDPESSEAAALLVELALDGVYRMEYDAITPYALRARELASRLDDRPLAASASAILAWGAGLTGAVEDGEAYRTEAAALVDALSDRELAPRLDAAINVGLAELYLDRFDDAGRHGERVVAVARATGQPAFVPFAFMLLAWVRMLQGQLAAGAEMLDGAVEHARLLGNTQSLAGLLLNRSLTALAAGDVEIAVRTAEESFELTRDVDNGLVPAATCLALSAAHLETADPRLGRSVEVMLERNGGARMPNMPGGSFRAKWLELLTRCWLALDRPEDAARAAAEAETVAVSMGSLGLARTMAGRAAAAVAFASDDVATAADLALASATAGDDVGVPVEAALSRLLAGRALAQGGDRAAAVEELERAATAFHACGARRYRDAADHELRRLGCHVHRRTRAGERDARGVAALTARELEVAMLVVDRRTNPEIAEALFLSPKTVETHLHNIFRKLDVASRVEVARVVEASARSPVASPP
jgi:DNA-binding CsgD family transcriptional regulator